MVPLNRLGLEYANCLPPKRRLEVRQIAIDITAWVTDAPDDPPASCACTVSPLDPFGMQASGPGTVLSGGAWLAVCTVSEGIPYLEYTVTLTVTSAAGRVFQPSARIYVPAG